MATRVFQLAKELGVTSKMILDKCRAEGLDLKNHMATLSAGLEATIREWFSEGSHITTVETAGAVDIDAARKEAAQERRRRRRKDGQPETDEEALSDAEVLSEEVAEALPSEEPAPAEEPVEEEAPAPEEPTEVVAEPPAPVVEEPLATPPVVEQAPVPPVKHAAAKPVTPAPTLPEAPAPAEAAPVAAAAPAPEVAPATPPAPAVSTPSAAVPNVPVKPDVKPAGPQLIPRPAQLQGPRVVRVERPDIMPPPRRAPGGYTGNANRGNAGNAGNAGGPSAYPTRRGPIGIAAAAAAAAAAAGKPGDTGEAGEGGEEGAAKKAKRRSPRRKGGRTAEGGEGIREWRDRDLDERRERLAAATGGGLRRHRASVRRAGGDPHAAEHDNIAEVDEPITIKSLSSAMGVKSAELIKKLMGQGVMATINQPISAETAETLALECGLELRIKRQKTAQEMLEDRMAKRQSENQVTRPPVVAFLGHVDHGKTSLLDRIRTARVVDTESGGITQHIGSYRYEKDGRVVAFLDTPGHEAFTQMRSRGANMTDVVVLVVAADDGVMPQTVEAINHAKAAGVPIVVALNKIDLPNANETRALGQLAEHGLQPREWGGNTEIIRTSAATGKGIDELVETLSLEAELLELKADPAAPAQGTVIEAEMDPHRGVVARLLVQNGTLKVGDVLLAGPGYGRVRQIVDDRRNEMDSAGPSTPVEVSGLDEVPTAGDKFYVVEDGVGEAKAIAEDFRAHHREQQLATKQKVTLDNLFDQISAGNVTELPLIVKADVAGSMEVLVSSLNKLSTAEVRVKILHAGVGGVSSSDVLLAEASNAVIVGFHVVPDAGARQLADQVGVDIRLYRIIYQLIDEVTLAMQGLLTPEIKEQVIGHAEVRGTFKVSRVGTIAGCYVTDGVVQRNAKLRITRNNIVVEDERLLDSLKRFKDDAREVRAGMECGIKIAGYDDVKVGDILEAYTTTEVARKL